MPEWLELDPLRPSDLIVKAPCENRAVLLFIDRRPQYKHAVITAKKKWVIRKPIVRVADHREGKSDHTSDDHWRGGFR